MSEWSAKLITHTFLDHKLIKNLLEKAINLKGKLEFNDSPITLEKAYFILLDNLESVEIKIDQNSFYIRYDDQQIYITCEYYPDTTWRKATINSGVWEVNDNVKIVTTMLDLASPFIVKDIEIYEAEYSILYYLNMHPREDGNEKIIKDTYKMNAFFLKIHMGSDGPIANKFESRTFVSYAYANKYIFIDNPKNQKVLDSSSLIDQIAYAFDNRIPTECYLKADDYILKIRFNRFLTSFYPVKPFKLKTIDGITHIDLDFYLRIILKLIELFDFNDLWCTFKHPVHKKWYEDIWQKILSHFKK